MFDPPVDTVPQSVAVANEHSNEARPASPSSTDRTIVLLDCIFAVLGLLLLALFTTRYLMPFRLDDVLLMDWARRHSPLDAFDPDKGQIVNSVRPVFALTSWLLTRLAGVEHPFWWHLTLTASLLIGLTFTGKTSRYLSGKAASLEVAVLLYFLVFTPILNVFFWYSDLTYGLELTFTAPAWFLILRGLYQGRPGSLLAGFACGALAILSKEPGVVLVHVITLGSLVLNAPLIGQAWRSRSRADRWWAIAGYVALLIVTLYIAFVSPTRSNRFFSLTQPDLTFFVADRIRFYQAIYLSPIARVLLFFPLLYLAAHAIYTRKRIITKGSEYYFLIVLAGAIAAFGMTNLLVAMSLMVASFAILSVLPNAEQLQVRALLPFVAALLIALITLLITIQLVKTQLTEAAFITVLLSGWAWCAAYATVAPMLKAALARIPLLIRYGSIALLVALAAIALLPKLRKQEQLLRNVKFVRQNANEAIQWAAKHLPANSVFAVTGYNLHGIEHGDVLTGKDDEAKLRQQYTFVGGYVYYYFEQLGRPDIQHAYLDDSLLLPRVLDAMREQPNAYLFLQTELDLTRFHRSNRADALSADDKLVARFDHGPYPSEIWKLGGH